MAFEEKRRLSQGLGSLAGDKLGVVMEIIAESQHFDSVRPSATCCISCEALGDQVAWWHIHGHRCSLRLCQLLRQWSH